MIDLATRLRKAPILVAPGVYDPLSALVAEAAGCEAVFVSGACVAMTHLARPDVGLVTASELADVVARICDRVSLPVFVDADQGFGNAAHVQRTVRALERAGAAAIQIEDQVAVKPASALRTRPLITSAEMVGKLHAAQDARRDEGFLISARTDACSTVGIADALARGEAYVAAGCDLLFIEGVKSAVGTTAIATQFGGRVPLVINLLEGGGAPFADAAAAQEGGFALALFPATAMGAATYALGTAYSALVSKGTSADVAERMVGLSGMNDIVGTTAFAETIAAYGDCA